MGLMGRLRDPYGGVEAWAYDRFLAPGALELVRQSGCRPWEDVAEDGCLVDVGCGGGHLMCEIARCRAKIRLMGVDLSRDQVGRGQRRAQKMGRSMGFAAGSALALPLKDGCAHAVVSIGSIKHWPDRRQGLSECVRVLRTGGRLMVLEFDRDSKDQDVERFLAQWRPPSFILPRVVARFRRNILHDSWDLGQARSLLDGMPLAESSVAAVSGAPVLLLTARKA